MSKINNNKGFTLIELLIVMVILGILVAIVFTNIDVGRLTGRGNDTKRVSDLRSIQDGILREQAQGFITLTPGKYNSADTANPNNQAVDGTGWVKFVPTAVAPVPYKFSNLAVLPLDPKNGTASVTYTTSEGLKTATARYVFCVSATGFEINSMLDNDAPKMQNDGGDDVTAYEVGTDLSACGTDKFGQ